MRAALTTKLVGLATERLDVTDPAVREHIQRLLAAQQDVERALAVLAQDLAAADVGPGGHRGRPRGPRGRAARPPGHRAGRRRRAPAGRSAACRPRARAARPARARPSRGRARAPACPRGRPATSRRSAPRRAPRPAASRRGRRPAPSRARRGCAPRAPPDRRQRAPVGDPAGDDPERVRPARRRRVRREHEPRARVRRAQHAAEAAEQRLQAPRPPAQPGGALEALGGRRRPHLRLHVRQQRGPAVDLEQAERLVEPLAVEVGIEVAQARRQAAPHLPVGRRVRPARQRPPAVAQAEQRVELLDQLGGRRPAAHRADADRVPGGRLARDLEDRERDVEPAAQVDVAVGLLLELRVAGRLERLDQPVLEHERAELGLGRLVVDVLGLAGPGRRAS